MTETKKKPTKIRFRKPVKIELQFPLEWDDKEIDSIILHRPKGKHLKKIKDGAGMEDLLLLACKVVEIPGSGDGPGVPNALISELDGADCVTIAEQLGDFLESGQKIGRL
jgi:hypothetical protein